MREILETMLRDVETETAPMRVLYEARKRMIRKKCIKRYKKKLTKINPHSEEFKGGKPISGLSFSTLIGYWCQGESKPGINRVFPINTEGYLT